MPSAANDSREEPASSNNFKDSKSIWQQCHVGSNPTVCARSSTLQGAAFLFLQQTMQGLQGGIRTARARRFTSRRLRQVSLLNSTLGSDFLLLVCKIPLLFL